MKIVIDGMGGDNSPSAVVYGAILATKEYDNIEIFITGPEKLIFDQLSKYEYDKNRIKVINAEEVISPNEPPVMAIRKKKNSSLNIALNFVKNGDADAVISGGSTGAFMAGSLLIIGRIKEIDRPAIASFIPGKNGTFMLIDCGANAECKPINLVQFGIMGRIYFDNIIKIKNPTVGLLNIGSEEEKGNFLTKEAYELLKSDKDMNFIGNVEPRDIPLGNVNIIVCDGFSGNTFLKTYEGTAILFASLLKQEVMSSFKSKIGGILLKSNFKAFKKRFDYKEYGGAAFLGVKGICIKAHGSSDSIAFKNAIRQAINAYDNKIVDKIRNNIENRNNISE